MRSFPFLALLFSSVLPITSYCLPSGADVVYGDVIVRRDGAKLIVRQNSSFAIIEWDSFDVAKGETVEFDQPSSRSSILNRVSSANSASQIKGLVEAFGSVYLTNPAGLLISGDGIVDASQFFASTQALSTQDFLAKRIRFRGSSTGRIANQGEIELRRDGALVAQTVDNSGFITTATGVIGLGGGWNANFRTEGNERLKILSGPGASTVSNKGSIHADQAELRARGQNSKILSISNTGHISVAGPNRKDKGRVFFYAKGGKLRHEGKIEARRSRRGGIVQFVAADIGLKDEARVDVSAPEGRGIILIGGDSGGENAGKVPNARITILEGGTKIDANATENGDGGDIVVWSTQKTEVHGKLSVRGGEKGGDGGYIEISGNGTVVFDGGINISAPKGNPGTFILN